MCSQCSYDHLCSSPANLRLLITGNWNREHCHRLKVSLLDIPSSCEMLEFFSCDSWWRAECHQRAEGEAVARVTGSGVMLKETVESLKSYSQALIIKCIGALSEATEETNYSERNPLQLERFYNINWKLNTQLHHVHHLLLLLLCLIS